MLFAVLGGENLIKRLIALATWAAAIAALAVGCGSDANGDEDTAVTTSSLTKTQYVKQANELCDDVEAHIAKEFRSFRPDDKLNPRLIAAVGGILAPATENQIDELRALGAPKGDEQEIEALLAAMEKEFDAAQLEHEQQKNQTPIEFLEGFNNFDKRATQYGLKACAFNF